MGHPHKQDVLFVLLVSAPVPVACAFDSLESREPISQRRNAFGCVHVMQAETGDHRVPRTADKAAKCSAACAATLPPAGCSATKCAAATPPLISRKEGRKPDAGLCPGFTLLFRAHQDNRLGGRNYHF
jgi:hypothetical protein